MDFVEVGALCGPVNGQILIYTPELREAIVCEFFTQGNYAIAHHHCDLNLQPCRVPDELTP